ncbi:hypothetical protein [Paenibacillus glycinis]|uniref:HEPN domain-containing protein n=1 Tax=Paenibacillus glycinis TaxID=2697035 RepID=A0ABW9XN57_9BACL|nr:hypothetical protein [Paenibacillus glycinis]NBD24062.1 hypothetical protein [Paenibacillus glycinis]
MGNTRLTGLRMTRESLSYIDAMHSILTHRGWFRQSKAMLAGMTVSGFRFTVDRELNADSWHAYNWVAEHFLAADFIGVTASSKAGFSFAPTFPLYQKHAVAMIKQSIDDGIGAVFWKDDFVIAAGYDDEEGALLYDDGSDPDGELHRLPYGDFGRNASPYWYYQTLEAQLAVDELEIYRESFMQAIYKWETHDPMLPEHAYACGKQAYAAFIACIDGGVYRRHEAASLITRYAAAKRDISAYADRLAMIWPACESIAACYAQVSNLFARLSICLPAGDDLRAVRLLREAMALEDQAIASMKSLMRERIQNRFEDIALR